MFNFQDTKPVRTQSEIRSSGQGVYTSWKNYLFHTGFQACSIAKIQRTLATRKNSLNYRCIAQSNTSFSQVSPNNTTEGCN